MSIGKISSKTDILQDPFDTGTNYTGVTNLSNVVAGIGGGGQPVKYGFILVKSSSIPVAPNGANLLGSKQVILSLNPQMISQDEPAATQITYTQNAGKYIERRGQICKTISIQGTTGYTPTPKVPDALRSSLPQSIIVKEEGPQSGLAQFLTLRALFREYWQTFSDDAYVNQRHNTLMIWINGKDDEHWVVEPLSFRMDRSTPGNKFTYQYAITMQTIAPVEAMAFDPDILTDFQKVGNVLAQITTAFNDITKAVAAIGNAVATLTGAIRDAVGVVTSLMTEVAGGLQNIITGVKEVIAIPKVFLGQMDDIKNSFMGAYGALLSVGDYTKALYGVDPIPFEVHQSLVSTAQTLADLSARKELFSTDFPTTWGKTIQNYSPSYGFGGFNKDLIAPLQKGGVQETTILPGDTLQNISVRELGNAERFMELVILNSLKPPYISPSQQDRSPNTLAPGDPILVPAIGAASGARALVRTTVFTDPNFTTVTNGFTSPNKVSVDTRGHDFRINQWAGFTVDIVGAAVQGGGGYIAPPNTYQSILTSTVASGGSGFGGVDLILTLPSADFATLPYQGFLLLDPGMQGSAYSPIPVSYFYPLNVFDTVAPNISTGTDTLSDTTGFYLTELNGGLASGQGAVYDDTTSNGTTIQSTTARVHQGTRSLKVLPSPSSLSAAGVRTAAIPVDGNSFYTVSFDINNGSAFNNGQLHLDLWCVGQDNTALFNYDIQMGPDGFWSRITHSFYVPPGVNHVQFFWVQPGGQDPDYYNFYLDALMLAKLPGQTSNDYNLWNSAGYASTQLPVHTTFNLPFSLPTNTPLVYSADGTLPPNQVAPNVPYTGTVGTVISNDATSLTLDKVLPHGPVDGDMIRIYLVRGPTDIVQRKSSQEQILGVDLKMAGTDLVVDASGRLQLVDSSDNVTQAILAKVRTRPGDLAAHPTFGLAFDPGTKVTPNLLFAYRVAVKQTLLSDARIDSIDQLTVILDRDTLQLSGYVVLVGSSQPYALDTRGAG